MAKKILVQRVSRSTGARELKAAAKWVNDREGAEITMVPMKPSRGLDGFQLMKLAGAAIAVARWLEGGRTVTLKAAGRTVIVKDNDTVSGILNKMDL
jgi:hypothetical protein